VLCFESEGGNEYEVALVMCQMMSFVNEWVSSDIEFNLVKPVLSDGSIGSPHICFKDGDNQVWCDQVLIRNVLSQDIVFDKSVRNWNE
jgi:hypothetical protein